MNTTCEFELKTCHLSPEWRSCVPRMVNRVSTSSVFTCLITLHNADHVIRRWWVVQRWGACARHILAQGPSLLDKA